MDPEVAGSKPVIHPNPLFYSMLSKRIVGELRWPMPDLSGFEVLVQLVPIAVRPPITFLYSLFSRTNHIDVAMSALRSPASEAKRRNVPWS